MPLSKSNTYTIEDIYALPEGKRTELIDGQIYDITTWQSFLNTEPQVFENTGSSIH